MMEGIDLLLKILDGGSDVALIVIAWAIWKLDRRVYRLEIQAGVAQ